MLGKKGIVVLAAAMALLQPVQIMAAGRSCVCEEDGGTCKCGKTIEQVAEEWEKRCRCNTSDFRSEEYAAASPASGEDEEKEVKEEKPRFIEILRDDSFIYFMDRKTARFLPIPHMAKEKMIDVWIKLEPLEFLENEYTYPSKYYLEHYLIRPKKQQIQFLAEMEVMGRPTGEAPNRRYDGRLWENIVPGTIEDAIYHAVLLHKDEIYDESTANGTGIRDFIENTINVSL